MVEDHDINELFQLVGDIGGTLDTVDEKNDQAHKEIKERLEDGNRRFEEAKVERELLNQRVEEHDRRLAQLEEVQQYIAAAAKFVVKHPKATVMVITLVVGSLIGLNLIDVLKLMGG